MAVIALGLGMADPDDALCSVCEASLSEDDLGTTCQDCDTVQQTSLLEYEPIFESYHRHGMRKT